MGHIVVETENLKTYFRQNRKSVVKAVDNVSLRIREGETLGLVGESGCGKSTLGRTILRLVPATSGEIRYRGKGIQEIPTRQMREYRKKMQLIFQNPYSSLNPRMTARESVEAPLRVYRENREAVGEKARRILEDVGLGSQYLDRFPHEFSGGQRQRIVIARALVLDPEFVVCDEPVSALDVSVRAQILNLLKDMQEKRNLAYLFISHDLSVVKHISDRVAVMYLGEILELADRDEFFAHPAHPYTQALLSAIPIPRVGQKRKRIPLQGEVPNVYQMPQGCKFHTRCPHAGRECGSRKPELAEVAKGHLCACHYNAPGSA